MWVGRLRGLIGLEIALLIGVMLAIGGMTSIAPARNTLALRANVPEPIQLGPYFEGYFEDDIHYDLEITPGWVGENNFNMAIYDHKNNPIDDVTLIRLRFDNLDQDLGTSELRPEYTENGIYTISGANLSTPGNWRVRATIQRPGQYDTVLDYEPAIELRPLPVLPPPLNLNVPFVNQPLILLFTGLAIAAIAGLVVGQNQPVGRNPLSLMGAPIFITGMIFLGSGVVALQQSDPLTAVEPQTISENAPVKLAFLPGTKLPYLITADGNLYEPLEDNRWQPIELDTPVRDAYFEANGTLWAATDDGLRVNIDGEWQVVDERPINNLEMTHGYIYGLGNTEINRLPAGGALDKALLLDIPEPEMPATEFVMLGNHSHVLHNGESVYLSPDLGLGWQPLDAPEAVRLIWTEPDSNLIAATDSGVWRVPNATTDWGRILPLPNGENIQQFHNFNEQLYALAGGQLYRQAGNNWTPIHLPDSAGANLTAIQSQAVLNGQRTFWVLDGAGSRLLSTTDGENWTQIPIALESV